MVFFAPFVAAALAGVAVAAPQYGSSSGSSYGSSSGSSYGSSSGSSYGSSSGSSYGSSGSSYGSSSSSSGCMGSECGSSGSMMSMGMDSIMIDSSTMMMDSTSTMMMDSTSTMMMESSTMMMDSTSTMMMAPPASTMMSESTSTMMMAPPPPASTMMYGSGSSNWGGSSYNSCVQQCMASYGAPMGTAMMAPPTATMGSSGTGATHTVIVAPSQGVLRFVPFYTNAAVGDTVKFMWNANMHTVTKSSSLEVCNKTDDAPFASGVQNKSFVFTQVVNDTNPTFFYCGVPTHCQKGMFGIINPPSATSANANTSAQSVMSSMAMNSSDVAAMMSYTSMATANNSAAGMWGSTLDISSMPSTASQSAIENVMFTRTFLAANPEVINSNGEVDLGAAGSAPFMVPQDISALAASASSSSSAAASSGSATASGSAAAATTSASKSGAGSVTASRAVVGVVAVAAAFFAL